MTTIIAHNGTLIADRMQLVSYTHHGITSVRDSPKIFKLPHCIYGISGTMDLSQTGDELHTLIMKRLAVISILRYFTQTHFYQRLHKKIREKKQNEYHAFTSELRSLLPLLTEEFAQFLNARELSLIALDRHSSYLFVDGFYYVHNNKATLTLGSASKVAIILLNHGLQIEKIYDSIRNMGAPTGVKLDQFSVQDLDNLFPPIDDPAFIAAFLNQVKTSILIKTLQDDNGQDQVNSYLDTAIAILAAFGSICEIKDGTVYFNENPTYDYTKPEDQSGRCYDRARSFVDQTIKNHLCK